MTDKLTQSALILADLKRGRSITPLDALRKHGVFRLAARIKDLRAAGHPIEKTMVEVASGARVAKYRLPKRRAAA